MCFENIVEQKISLCHKNFRSSSSLRNEIGGYGLILTLVSSDKRGKIIIYVR